LFLLSSFALSYAFVIIGLPFYGFGRTFVNFFV
jgi:hypothetical protein